MRDALDVVRRAIAHRVRSYRSGIGGAIAHRVRSYMKAGHWLLGSFGFACDGYRMWNRSGHQALRKGRVSMPGQIYLLTMVTAERTPWFMDVELARAVCRLLIQPKVRGDAHLICWVLMPDHWHGLIKLGERDALSAVMNRFKSLTSKCIRQMEPNASVWARGFYDRALRRDEDIKDAARYIIANPLRAGLVQRAGDYPYWNCEWL